MENIYKYTQDINVLYIEDGEDSLYKYIDYNDRDYLQDAIDSGISQYFLKPIDVQKLKKIIYSISKSIRAQKKKQSHLKHLPEINLKKELNTDYLIDQNDLFSMNKILTLINSIVLETIKNTNSFRSKAERIFNSFKNEYSSSKRKT